jgi:hypothetical protein
MLGGLIAGALSGAAKGGNEVATMGLERENKIDLAKAMADIDEQKQLRIDEVTRGRDIADIGKKAAATTQATIDTAPLRQQAYDVDAPLRASQRAEKALDVKSEATAKVEAEADATKKLGGDKGYVSALRTLADAKESSASRVQAALGQIQLDNSRRVEALRTEYGKATPERKDAIREEIQLLTGKDNDNYMPVPIKDEMGNVTGYQVFDKKRGDFVTPKGSGTPGNAADPLGLFGKPGAPAPAPAGTPAPVGQAGQPASPVAGRPLYNTSQSELQRRAARPKGVSSAEAAEAQAELDKRAANGGESRMSAY